MKRILLTTCALFLIAGCASNRSGSTEDTKSDTPDWWFSPATSETHYYGFGQAKKQNPSLAQKTATERSRAEISSQVVRTETDRILCVQSVSNIPLE